MQIGVDSERAVETRRVYVADDDDVVATALQFMLADELETHVLATLAALLDKVAVAPPALILLGTGLLAGGPEQIMTSLRAACPQARVLVVCTDPGDPAVRQALEAGANGVLQRPLKIEQVRRKVDAQLGRRLALDVAIALG